MIGSKAFIISDVTETVAQFGNGCTESSCLVQLPSNLRCCNLCWAM